MNLQCIHVCITRAENERCLITISQLKCERCENQGFLRISLERGTLKVDGMTERPTEQQLANT